MRDGKSRLALIATVTVTLLTVTLGPTAVAADRVAIQAGRVITVSGPEIPGGIILIEDGRITAVGEGLEIPFDAMVIDASDKVVMPGLVEPHTQNGLDVPNENLPVTPFVSVYDALDPVDYYFEDALREGITTIGVVPGHNCVIGGMGRVVRPQGVTVEEMTVLDEMGLKLSMAPKRGMNRMTQMAMLREAFLAVDDHLESLAEKKYVDEHKKGKEEFHYDPNVAREQGRSLIKDADVEDRWLNLLRLTRGELPAFIYCELAMDVPHALETAKERGFFDKTVLVLDADCYKAVDLVKESGRPVILSSVLIYEERDPVTNEKKETFVPGVFSEHGIPFAIQRSSRDDLARGHFWYQAAICVREGMEREKALKAVTLWSAEAIGVGSRLGSIEPGKDADLVILTGDPLQATSWVDKVLLAGRVAYEREKDTRLEKLLKGLPAPSTEAEKPKEESPAEKKEGEEGKPSEEKPAEDAGKTKESGLACGSAARPHLGAAPPHALTSVRLRRTPSLGCGSAGRPHLGAAPPDALTWVRLRRTPSLGCGSAARPHLGAAPPHALTWVRLRRTPSLACGSAALGATALSEE
ncbi:MAG: amidohydrolase family protein [Planctomycetota bacterium]